IEWPTNATFESPSPSTTSHPCNVKSSMSNSSSSPVDSPYPGHSGAYTVNDDASSARNESSSDRPPAACKKTKGEPVPPVNTREVQPRPVVTDVHSITSAPPQHPPGPTTAAACTTTGRRPSTPATSPATGASPSTRRVRSNGGSSSRADCRCA